MAATYENMKSIGNSALVLYPNQPQAHTFIFLEGYWVVLRMFTHLLRDIWPTSKNFTVKVWGYGAAQAL